MGFYSKITRSSDIELKRLNAEGISTNYRGPWKSWLLFIFIIGFSVLGSFLAGQYTAKASIYNDVLGAPSLQMFAGNESFIGKPSTEKDLAWKSLMPEKGGFFEHPKIAREKSVFAVFHQMHCLENVWRSWWLVYEASKNGTVIVGSDMPPMLNPIHVNHCVELLRLSLQCRPDLTLEAISEKGGVEGFGVEHQCYNWEELLQWTSRWELNV